jgi:Domain of unknown function (DUF4105)
MRRWYWRGSHRSKASCLRGSPPEKQARRRSRFCSLCLACLICAWGLAAFAESSVNIAVLQDKAIALRLYERRYWQVLLHYEPKGSGIESLVDDPGFFLSASGKTDPQAELLATLEALFGAPEPSAPDVRCRFLARRAWLQAEMGIAVSDLDALSCPEFSGVWQRVAPQSATLVFPGSYTNSPASMFGHTLLIFTGPYKSKPLAHAAGYSAFTNESNGLVYALKGITGGYRGYFTLLPYYEKIKEYSGLERRDMWEYRLRLSPVQTEKMFLHLWELRDVYSDYFFFDENCSYNLLYLIEAARPDLQLTGPRPLWVMPIDTVRLLNQHGLLEAPEYRPSLATRLRLSAGQLDAEQTVAALRLVRGEGLAKDLVFAGKSRAQVLETAAESIELQYVQHKLDLSSYRQRYLAVLAERSRLRCAEGLPLAEALLRPDYGHGSSRFGVGVGVEDSRWFQEWRLRPAYHSLLDPPEGFLAGSQIILGDLAVRVKHASGTIQLERFRLVDIISLAPIHSFDKPISWQARIGLRRITLDDSRTLGLYLNPGGGFSIQNAWGLGYLLLESEGLVTGALQDSLALGFGAGSGWIMQWGRRWRAHLRVRYMAYLSDKRLRLFSVEVNQGLKINRQNSLSIEISRQARSGRWGTTGTFFWNHYW